ncbi:MAG: TetR/AcrR family transcriptional regulator [Armatimonadetes bacterium]|nr:TetR/AcrR family transcriptional regulator [Armatimonadota bacterium]
MAEKRRRLTGEERRETILEAALALFSERGFTAATTRELAARAGITEAVIYRHFRSKAEVLQGVLEHYTFLPELRRFAEVPTDAPLRDQFLELGRNWRRLAMETRPLFALFLSEMHREPDLAHTLRDGLVRQAVTLVVRALRARAAADVPVERLETAVRLFFSSLLWHFVLEERMGAEPKPEQAEARMQAGADLIARALRE